MLKIAILGTRGIPNNYGGFETLAEYLVEYLSKDFEITVFCSSKDIPTKMVEFKSAKLKYIFQSNFFKPLRQNKSSLFLAMIKIS